VWWIVIAAILFVTVVFQAKLAPGEKLLAREGFTVGGGTSWVFQQVAFGFTPVDLLVFAFAYAALMYRMRMGYTTFSRRAGYMTLICAVVIAVALSSAMVHGTDEPFGDWRYFVTGALFAFALWSTVMRDEQAPLRFAQLLVGIAAGYAAFELAAYAAGGGETANYGRIPVGDHAKLEIAVAAVAVSLAMLRTRRSPLLWYAGAALCTALVVLSFRRYAWVELAIVFAVFLIISGPERGRYRWGAIAILGVAAVAVTLTWSSLQWEERFASLDPRTTKAENALAATNQGHLDEIRDGIDQVQARPIFGLGPGVGYVGERTVVWKGTGGMVHNAPLEVWIEFGLLGLLAYLGAYALFFREVWKRRWGTALPDIFAIGAAAFFLANFLVTATVYGWAYSHQQQSIILFGLLAGAFPALRGVTRAVPGPAAGRA
jgi:hypothetical protein